jgi:hypothetical protein
MGALTAAITLRRAPGFLFSDERVTRPAEPKG